MEYYMYLAIGDYEKKKYGRYRKFLFKSNKPLEDVRKAHHSIEAVLGFPIESLCAKDFEDTVSDETYQKIKDLGFGVSAYFREVQGQHVIGPYGLAALWAFLLQKADPELTMLVVSEAGFPFVNSVDPEEKIGPVGYGLFY
mgnify:CR=1 FL=1